MNFIRSGKYEIFIKILTAIMDLLLSFSVGQEHLDA
jgi:hypothetical protein